MNVNLRDTVTVTAMIERLWLKSEAAQWAAERQRLLALGINVHLQIAPHDRRFFSMGKSLNCYLWMLDPGAGRTTDIDGLNIIGACYVAVTEAVSLVHVLLNCDSSKPSEISSGLQLLAEAQSALRFSVAQCNGYVDDDQKLIYDCLREIANERGIVISTGMKLDAPIDPSEAASIFGRVHALHLSFMERQRNGQRISKALAKLRFKVSELCKSDPTSSDYTTLAPVVQELIDIGLQPSRIEFRNVLLPVIHRLPQQNEVPKPFSLVIRELHRFSSAVTHASESPQLQIESVGKVAEFLSGRSIVMIGGNEQPNSIAAIQEAFGVSSVVWISTSPHDSFHDVEPYVARKDVAVVLQLIRWSSHSFGNVATICRKYGKPFVRLTGGYNPNQIAAAILEQASHRLSMSTNGGDGKKDGDREQSSTHSPERTSQ